ncbi:MAG: hypothetical protein ACKPKO_16380, partial [Candidatus Fonsibacter sp.]
MAEDVWDILRRRAETLAAMLAQIPTGGLLLIIGGSPCQQLTMIGPGVGHIGLTGKDSVNLFAFSVIAWLAQRLRPDLHVHVVAENAGNKLGIHRACIKRVFG